MSCGKHFVAKLMKLGYANAEKLNGGDFDWLFDSTDTRSFLEWFCGHVSEQLVVSEDTLNSFNSLKESGKFILDEKDLDDVLKTCKTTESRNSNEDEVELEKLEEELKSLQKIKNVKMNWLNELQVMASANGHMSLTLRDEREVAAKNLKHSQENLGAKDAKVINEMNILVGGVKLLISFFNASPVACGSGSQAVLLSKLPLDSYLSQEEQRTVALTSYTKLFFEGISDLIDSSNKENVQLLELDVNRSLIHEESNDMREESRREMARLQLAYICAKMQVVQLKASGASLKAGLQCAEEQLRSVQNKTRGEENSDVRIASLKNELVHVNSQVKQIQSGILPELVTEKAHLLNMPIVKGDFDLQIARQDYYTSKQDLVRNMLMKQKSCFELLLLAYEIELRKHREVHRQLEALVENLKQSSKALSQRLEMLSDPSISQFAKPKNTIDSKDGTSHRIYLLIEGQNKKQQLFKTYEGLEQIAMKLMHNITLLQNQLGDASQEKSLIVSKMDADVKTLQETLYCGEGYLLLSAPALSEQFQQLESQMQTLNQLVVDIGGDLKNKRKILKTNKLHKMEKQLYVHFFQKTDYLKGVVEQLETQAGLKETS